MGFFGEPLYQALSLSGGFLMTLLFIPGEKPILLFTADFKS
jgi:hypothetical protein